ncbi:MAG: adenine phosphoribosyltransferase [Bacteroidales bacterium]|nr:adenine phosphoribosyltransferase [Bacteroidales bacterium]
MNVELLKQNLRAVPDFPIKGIQFWDITTLMKNPVCMKEMAESMYELYKDKGITKVVGIESRGFFLAPALALRLGVGFVPIRKPGKLPAETISYSYTKEYGVDTLEIHKDALTPDDVVLVHDDVLATGGSSLAAIELVKKSGAKKVYANFLIELDSLHGKDKLPADVQVDTFLHL